MQTWRRQLAQTARENSLVLSTVAGCLETNDVPRRIITEARRILMAVSGRAMSSHDYLSFKRAVPVTEAVGEVLQKVMRCLGEGTFDALTIEDRTQFQRIAGEYRCYAARVYHSHICCVNSQCSCD